MNRSISCKKNELNNDFLNKIKKYNIHIQFVNNINANASIIRYQNKYIIFVNNKVPIKLLPLVIFHEFGHIRFNTINSNPRKYRFINEFASNLYAIIKIRKIFSFLQKFILIVYTFVSEKKLYIYFNKFSDFSNNDILIKNILSRKEGNKEDE